MINNTRGLSSQFRISGQNLESVQSFKYLGSVIIKRDLSRIVQTVGALSKLKTIMMHSFTISIFLYACESWTLSAELERKIQATEMRCFRRLLGISYRDHVTNEEVRNTIRHATGPYEDLIPTVRKRKLRWYG